MAPNVRVAFTMSEEAERLKERTKRFALDVFDVIKLLPALEPGPTIRRQLAKSATSVPTNYRAACHARSHAEFTARISVVAEEADESTSWLDMLAEARLVSSPMLSRLQQEARELVAIFSACVGTARRNARARSQ